MYPSFPISWQKAIKPCIMFPQAPLSSRTAGFPGSGWQSVIIGSFIAQPSPTNGSLSARPHTPLIRTVYHATIPRLRFHPYWALCPMMVSSFRQSLYREPLHLRAGVTCLSMGFKPHVTRYYPGFIAPTGSCARPKSSHSLGFNLVP